MELHGAGRCGALCQHPGCWSSGKKQQPLQKFPPEVLHYLTNIAVRRKLKEWEAEENPKHQDLPCHSHSMDVLPTLKVQTLEDENLQEHKRSRTFPTLIHRKAPSSAADDHRTITFNVPRVNYAQVALEEEDVDEVSKSTPNLTFRPVLIWRPRHKKKIPSPRSPRDTKPTTAQGNDSSSPSKHYVDVSKNTFPNETRKQFVAVRKTGLPSATLLYKEEPQRSKLSSPQHQWKPVKLSAADESLTYLGDIDLPPQVMEEILHQLRSESTSTCNVNQTHLPSGSNLSESIPPNSPPRHTHPTTCRPLRSLAYDLSKRRIVNLSASRFNDGHRCLSGVSSFSRKLSMRPTDALDQCFTQGKRRRLPQRLPNFSDYQPSGEVRGDISRPSLGSGLFAAGRSTHLHRRKVECSSSPVITVQSPTETISHMTASSGLPIVQEDSKNTTMVPRVVVAHASAPAVYLKLNPQAEFSQQLTPRAKDAKPSPRFIQIPKYRYSVKYRGTPRSYSEDSVTVNEEIKLVLQSQVLSHEEKGQEKFERPTPSPRHLPSESPDYMLVGAKFDEGHLILTDREGVVTQRIRESESEANFDHPSVSFEAGRLSRVSMHREESEEQDAKDHQHHLEKDKREGDEGVQGSSSSLSPQERGVGVDKSIATSLMFQPERVKTPPPSPPEELGINVQTPEGIRTLPLSTAAEIMAEGLGAPLASSEAVPPPEGIRAPRPSAAIETEDFLSSSEIVPPPGGIRAPPPSAAIETIPERLGTPLSSSETVPPPEGIRAPPPSAAVPERLGHPLPSSEDVPEGTRAPPPSAAVVMREELGHPLSSSEPLEGVRAPPPSAAIPEGLEVISTESIEDDVFHSVVDKPPPPCANAKEFVQSRDLPATNAEEGLEGSKPPPPGANAEEFGLPATIATTEAVEGSKPPPPGANAEEFGLPATNATTEAVEGSKPPPPGANAEEFGLSKDLPATNATTEAVEGSKPPPPGANAEEFGLSKDLPATNATTEAVEGSKPPPPGANTEEFRLSKDLPATNATTEAVEGSRPTPSGANAEEFVLSKDLPATTEDVPTENTATVETVSLEEEITLSTGTVPPEEAKVKPVPFVVVETIPSDDTLFSANDETTAEVLLPTYGTLRTIPPPSAPETVEYNIMPSKEIEDQLSIAAVPLNDAKLDGPHSVATKTMPLEEARTEAVEHQTLSSSMKIRAPPPSAAADEDQ